MATALQAPPIMNNARVDFPPALGAGTPLPPVNPGAPPTTPRVVAPNVPPMQAPPNFTPPTVGTFGGAAPTATPYGDFTAPDPTKLGELDPSYGFDLAQQQKALQRSALARGTLLTGATGRSLQTNASGVAASHYGDIFNRALGAYTANRDTNAQNFGQNLGSFNAGLGAFNANTSATLGAGRLGLDAADAAYGHARDAYHDTRDAAAATTEAANINATNQHQDALDEYARQAAQQRATIAQAAAIPPRGPAITRFQPGGMR